MNEHNLIPFDQRAESEQRRIRSAGGKARAEKALAKKHGRELLQAMLSMKEPDPTVVAELAKSYGIDPAKVTKEMAMHGRQIDKAIRKADTNAYNAVNKASGTLDTKEGESATINLIIGTEAAAAADKWSK